MRFGRTFLSSACMLLTSCSNFQKAKTDTAKSVFREAVTVGRTAEQGVQWYIFREIAVAQAVRGYYDDAMETARLVNEYPDQLFVELVSIRAKNGDIAGAKKTAMAAPTDVLKSRADEVIAMVQASSGDFDGARETSRGLPDKSSVLEAIGVRQVDQGDLEGALKTASEMKQGWSDGVLFDIAAKLRERGDKQGAHKIALRITDPDMVQTAEGARTEPSKARISPMSALEWLNSRRGLPN